MPFTDPTLERCIVDLLAQRSPSSSICPSDVARALADDEGVWRGLMPQVREVAKRMAANGIIRVTQGDSEVTIDEKLSGPIRLRRGENFQ
ncbi:DUF3253 domain-containing protein [Xanthomonas sp. WHRI 1810A]|uniref:DUF3253 domain-containing protein n=1 Tax=Xanthomonas sp. WHRI 1810A TaxID=3161565 RepID=UPI0032E8E254